MSRVKLSILIPTIPNRVGNKFLKLVEDLQKQIGNRKNVEILGLFDNKRRTLGEKRDTMLQMAIGDYVVFIDDDDRIASTYVSDILEILTNNPTADCVVFDSICTINRTKKVHCKYGIEYEYTPKYKDLWTGKPAHTMVYKATIAKRHKYGNMTFGEDVDWVKRACKEIKNQVRIDKVLYYYDCNKSTSETSGPLSKSSLNKPEINL
jgi:glycosyltransferase involved in cell wall biosynthesis